MMTADRLHELDALGEDHWLLPVAIRQTYQPAIRELLVEVRRLRTALATSIGGMTLADQLALTLEQAAEVGRQMRAREDARAAEKATRREKR